MISEEQKQNFIDAIIEAYKQHGLTLAHEDSQGAFLIQKYTEELGELDHNILWLKEAEIDG